jgi:hypothetical protein
MSNLVVRTVEDLREHFEQQALHYAHGLRSDRLLARCAPHGQWLEWLA